MLGRRNGCITGACWRRASKVQLASKPQAQHTRQPSKDQATCRTRRVTTSVLTMAHECQILPSEEVSHCAHGPRVSKTRPHVDADLQHHSYSLPVRIFSKKCIATTVDLDWSCSLYHPSLFMCCKSTPGGDCVPILCHEVMRTDMPSHSPSHISSRCVGCSVVATVRLPA